MNKSLSFFAKQCYLLTQFFHNNVKFFFSAASFFSLSKVAQTISFFLPIKVLIMISMDKPPAYFESLKEIIPYRNFIIIVLLSVPFFYILYMLLGLVYRKLIDLDLKVIWSSQYDGNGFQLKTKDLRIAYTQTSRLMSDIFLCSVVSIIALSINVYIGALVLLLSYVMVNVFLKHAFQAKEDDRVTFVKIHRKQLIEYTLALSYMVVFFSLVAFVYYSLLGVYETIFLLLISRLYLQGLQRIMVETMYLNQHIQSHKIS